jgi:DOPA 4,5-dioxygenase
MSDDAPFHAHVYYAAGSRDRAASLRDRLRARLAPDGLLFVGELRDHKVGPHPVPQFECHFHEPYLAQLMPTLESCGLTVLVHPLTLDDTADHTTLARWVGGAPIELDLSVMDPPGVNQGFARFGKTDF